MTVLFEFWTNFIRFMSDRNCTKVLLLKVHFLLKLDLLFHITIVKAKGLGMKLLMYLQPIHVFKQPSQCGYISRWSHHHCKHTGLLSLSHCRVVDMLLSSFVFSRAERTPPTDETTDTWMNQQRVSIQYVMCAVHMYTCCSKQQVLTHNVKFFHL